ncbi:TrbC family F-type conjugative pilus assembly protein [Klebsiella pneumoniae]|jgi:conjugal transfer pilus assembly protein TraW|uniref:Conjugal transfer protein n=9 Tax=Enterobacteriaceae TaxID=543 RepID=A0A417ZQP3_ECOLX|nr:MULTISPECIES: TrbC family F-type conjugative pilus assembly protein [Enterobacteriaceae]EBM6644327.1 conjugal transfer protein [Salmonella enterica subsp. enterica serovar Senftenberg]EDY7370470.1 conjugal transfer protein [Salmonella enterica]EIF2004635.1 conjugal transfer protein [Salmonella enterica subsp. enterica serovar Montevideo]EKB0025210.1 conjugal transfer protein [Salmonella enterica subsp. enterica serovar Schwarzengrund]EKV7916537.1 conjugal transfer protein [Citrobacter koser
MPSSECIKKLLFSCLLATSLSYADDSIDHAKTQSIESIVGTPRYNPSSVSDSVRAVIEHTGKLREAEAMSDIAQDIKKNQSTEAFSEEADTINKSKNESMRTQSSNVEKMFGRSGITAQDFERKLDNNKNEELSTDNGLTIFASFSMPDYVLIDLIKTASENNARVVFRGLKEGVENLIQMQVVLRDYISKAKIKKEPLVTLDPESFTQYSVKEVPTMVYRKDDKTYKISGSINIKYFMKQIEENPEKTTFPVSAQTFPIKEKSIVQELEERSNKYDWEAAKKNAIKSTWQNQWMASLPVSDENKIWYIDPTIQVNQDIRDNQGNLIAAAGQKGNPLAQFPQKLTMIVFDPMNSEQLTWAKIQFRHRFGEGKVMPIFTRIKRDDGWKHLEELRGQFYGQMYKINPEIISRFLIKSTPTIISVEGTYFKVQQFAQADVREYTRINQQSEKEAAQ